MSQSEDSKTSDKGEDDRTPPWVMTSLEESRVPPTTQLYPELFTKPAPVPERTASMNPSTAPERTASMNPSTTPERTASMNPSTTPERTASTATIKIEQFTNAVATSIQAENPPETASDVALSRLFNQRVQKIMDKKYEIIEVVDSKPGCLDRIIKIILNVNKQLPSRQLLSEDVIQRARNLTAEAGFQSIGELEEKLQQHKSFRETLRDLFSIQRNRNFPSSSNDQSPTKSESDVTSCDDQRDCSQSQEHDIQPFSGDVNVRPKIRHHSSGDKSGSLRNKLPTSRGGIAQPERGDLPAENGSPRTTPLSPRAEDSRDRIMHDFDKDLYAMIEEANKTDDSENVAFLTDLKLHFLIADTIHFILQSLLQQVTFTKQPKASEQRQSLVRRLVHVSDQAIMTPSQLVASSEITCTYTESKKSAEHLRTSQRSEGHSDSAFETVKPTWQSKVRECHKRKPKSDDSHLIDICRFCHGLFRWPHLLACCHTYCYPCLLIMYDHTRKFIVCPICKCVTEVPSLRENLRLFRVDINISRRMIDRDLSPFCCTACITNDDAIKFCDECMEYLCQKCCIKHAENEATFSHNLEETDMKIGVGPDGELTYMCNTDPGNILIAYCKTCNKSLCDICLPHHDGHLVYKSLAAHELVKNRMKEQNLGTEICKRLFHETLMTWNVMYQSVDTQCRAARQKINDFSNFQMKLIQDITEKSHTYLDRVGGHAKDEVKKRLNRMDVFLYSAEQFKKIISDFLKYGSTVETTCVLPVLAQAHAILEEEFQIVVKEDIKVDFAFEPDYQETTNLFGKLFSTFTTILKGGMSEMLSSFQVRERHYVQPCKPSPFSAEYRRSVQEELRAAREAKKNAAVEAEDTQTAVEAEETQTAAAVETNVDSMFYVEDEGQRRVGQRRVRERYMGQQQVEQQYVEQVSISRTYLPTCREFGQYGRGDYKFMEPSGIRYLHDGSLAVCDTRNHRIVVYKEDGNFHRTIGEPPNPHQSTARDIDRTYSRTDGVLCFPFRMAQCLLTKNIVVVERPPNPGVHIFTFQGQFVRRFRNKFLQNPRAVAVDDQGLILIIESKTMTFFLFTADGELMTKSILETLQFPNDIVTRKNTIYISDNHRNCVVCYDYALNHIYSIGNEGLTYYPIGVGFNHRGHLVVTDNHNTFNVTIFNTTGFALCGYKSPCKHSNCYNVAMHPSRAELALTTKDCKVIIYKYGELCHVNVK